MDPIMSDPTKATDYDRLQHIHRGRINTGYGIDSACRLLDLECIYSGSGRSRDIVGTGNLEIIDFLERMRPPTHEFRYYLNHEDRSTGKRMMPGTREFPPTPETVNYPSHYGDKDSPYVVIKVLEAWLTVDEMRGFLKGNIIKYNARARLKGGPEDYKKAAWYSNYLVEFEERHK
jgi:hypothetical protein